MYKTHADSMDFSLEVCARRPKFVDYPMQQRGRLGRVGIVEADYA